MKYAIIALMSVFFVGFTANAEEWNGQLTLDQKNELKEIRDGHLERLVAAEKALQVRLEEIKAEGRAAHARGEDTSSLLTEMKEVQTAIAEQSPVLKARYAAIRSGEWFGNIGEAAVDSPLRTDGKRKAVAQLSDGYSFVVSNNQMLYLGQPQSTHVVGAQESRGFQLAVTESRGASSPQFTSLAMPKSKVLRLGQLFGRAGNINGGNTVNLTVEMDVSSCGWFATDDARTGNMGFLFLTNDEVPDDHECFSEANDWLEEQMTVFGKTHNLSSSDPITQFALLNRFFLVEKRSEFHDAHEHHDDVYGWSIGTNDQFIGLQTRNLVLNKNGALGWQTSKNLKSPLYALASEFTHWGLTDHKQPYFVTSDGEVIIATVTDKGGRRIVFRMNGETFYGFKVIPNKVFPKVTDTLLSSVEYR